MLCERIIDPEPITRRGVLARALGTPISQCAPINTSGSSITPSWIMANGSILTPAPISAFLETTARGEILMLPSFSTMANSHLRVGRILIETDL